MAEVLELPHLSQYDRMAEVYIGTGRVQAELDSQLSVRFSRLGELLAQLGLGKDFDRATF